MKTSYFLLTALLLAGCGTSPGYLTATAMMAQAQTQTVAPRLTPTFTPQPTSTSTSTPHPIQTREDAGLVWQECEIAQSLFVESYNILELSNKCFGQTEVSYDGDKVNSNVKRVGSVDFELTIGSTVYRTETSGESMSNMTFVLYKNNRPVRELSGKVTGYSPNLGLLDIGGKAAWEFADGDIATIIYDDQDVRDLYDLDKAFRPYSLDNKLIFIGQKDSKYFVIYDGVKRFPEFDSLSIGYCCDGVLYSVVRDQGRYLFLGSRNDRRYLIQIEAID
jgi:hypothetical protein